MKLRLRTAVNAADRSRIRAVDSRHANIVMLVPFAFAALLRQNMLSISPPRRNGRFIAPIGNRDAEAVLATGALDAQVTRHSFCQFFHALSRGSVFAVSGCSEGREDYRIAGDFEIHRLPV